MTNHQDALQPLFEVLEKDLESTQTLCQLLETEKQVLTDRDFLKLTDLANQKQTLIYEMEQNNQLKILILRPLTSENNGLKLVDFLVEKFGKERALALQALNETLEEKLAHCRKQNMVNGQVIVRNLQNNKELLALVTGQSNGAEDLYNSLDNISQDSISSSQHDSEV